MKEHHLLKKYCPYKFIYALLLVASESWVGKAGIFSKKFSGMQGLNLLKMFAGVRAANLFSA